VLLVCADCEHKIRKSEWRADRKALREAQRRRSEIRLTEAEVARKLADWQKEAA
jgi:hypothetical protein